MQAMAIVNSWSNVVVVVVTIFDRPVCILSIDIYTFVGDVLWDLLLFIFAEPPSNKLADCLKNYLTKLYL